MIKLLHAKEALEASKEQSLKLSKTVDDKILLRISTQIKKSISKGDYSCRYKFPLFTKYSQKLRIIRLLEAQEYKIDYEYIGMYAYDPNILYISWTPY